MPKASVKARVCVVDHPLVVSALTRARMADTPPHQFRDLMRQIGRMLAYEATRDLPMRQEEIRTPLEACRGPVLATTVTIVPILRAGLGLGEGALALLPEAQMGHIGMFRDERALSPVSYYENLPRRVAAGPVLLVDPMLATGGSAMSAVELLRRRGCEDVRFLCAVAAPEGIETLQNEHPGVPVFTAAIDRELDERGYILPGLGDAGDRIFGTQS